MCLAVAKLDDYLTDSKDVFKAIYLFNEAVANFEQKEFKNSINLFNQLLKVILAY